MRKQRTQQPDWAALHQWAATAQAQILQDLPPLGPQPAEATSGPAADDFLPADLRVPSHDQVAGRMMPWRSPLVIDGEVAACPECGKYRDWLILSTQDEVWLRCRAGHQYRETRLDTAWYNRHAGPADATHATFEDCLRHLGH
ncbi:hypothetical protein [Streptomyces albus]|uniref:hypothetical protein n=1 Tax=Streptomyces albus TaxID=1888 RepID=UPI003F1D2D16